MLFSWKYILKNRRLRRALVLALMLILLRVEILWLRAQKYYYMILYRDYGCKFWLLDYYMFTYIVTTGTKILLRVYILWLRVQQYYYGFVYRDYGCIFWLLDLVDYYVFTYFDYGYTGTTILLWVCLSLLRVFILTTLLLRVYILWIRIQVQSKYKLKNQLRV